MNTPESRSTGAAETKEAELTNAELVARRLDKPMGVLGVVFLFLVLAQLLATETLLSRWLAVAGWAFWVVFVGEFILRAYIAGFQRAFWKRNWWQVVFLLVPFLRFFRALQSLRLFRLTRVARFARFGGIISAGVRGSRSAGTLLSSRIGWLIAVTAVVVLGVSQLSYATGLHSNYGDALYEAAMATITGTGLTPTGGFARVLQVILAVYSVAVFATLAGSLGAFFLGEKTARAPVSESVSGERVSVEHKPSAPVHEA